MGLCAVSRWCEGCKNTGEAPLSSALYRISERITPTFQTLSHPEEIGGQPSKNKNLNYSMGYGGESVSQLPLKDKAFLTLLGQNPPFELRPKTGTSPPSFHGIHRGSSNYWPNPSIFVGSGKQVWLAFAVRRQGHTFESCRVRGGQSVGVHILLRSLRHQFHLLMENDA